MEIEVSQLLARWSTGDQAALQELMPVVYGELRRLGRSALRRGHDSMLQPTALVHEAWLRLAGNQHVSMENRPQFYGLAAKLMRDILMDQVRRRQSAKRGGALVRVPLEGANLQEAPVHAEFLVLHEAMTRLGAIKPRYTEIMELRCLAGLTIEETAGALQLSHATIEREWNFARIWVRRELQRESWREV